MSRVSLLEEKGVDDEFRTCQQEEDARKWRWRRSVWAFWRLSV